MKQENLFVFILFLAQFCISTAQTSCKVPLPPGAEDGLDTSGLRVNSTERRNEGDVVEYFCPDAKVGESDGKHNYSAVCTQVFRSIGELKKEFGNSWPLCTCPVNISCDLELAEQPVTLQISYPSQEDISYHIGLLIINWNQTKRFEIKLTWDKPFDNFFISPRNPSIDIEENEELNNEHTIFVKDGAELENLPYFWTLDLDIVSSEPVLDSFLQRWQLPCIIDMECKLKDPEEVNLNLVAGIVAGISAINGVIFAIFAGIVKCIKKCTEEEERPVTQYEHFGSTASVKTNH